MKKGMTYRVKPKFFLNQEIGAYKVTRGPFHTEENNYTFYEIECQKCKRKRIVTQRSLCQIKQRPGKQCKMCVWDSAPKIAIKTAHKDRLQKFKKDDLVENLRILNVKEIEESTGLYLEYDCQCEICGTKGVRTFQQLRTHIRNKSRRCAACITIIGKSKLDAVVEEYYEKKGELKDEEIVPNNSSSYPELGAIDPDILKKAMSGKW